VPTIDPPALPTPPLAKVSGTAPDPTPLSTHAPGQIVGARYRLQSLLGRGTHGETWSAEHVELGRPVALKFVLSSDAGLAERMLHETRALARIRHPHIAEISDFGRCDDGHAFFVSELLVGMSLQQRLDQRGPIPWARAVGVAQQVSEALVAGHAQGVVHGDLRPANVFWIETGQPGDFVKLVDFGLGRASNPGRLDPASLGFNSSRGSAPEFISPEQAAGLPLEVRSDVYGVGCLLHALITGDPPFAGTPAQVLHAQLHQAPKTLRERVPRQFIPDELEHLVARCLAKQPNDRYASMIELREELRELARATGPKAYQSTVGGERSQVMGYAGRAAPRDAAALEQSLKPITQSVPIVPPRRASLLELVGLGLGVALLVIGAGIGAFFGVRALIAEPAGSDVPAEAAAPAPIEPSTTSLGEGAGTAAPVPSEAPARPPNEPAPSEPAPSEPAPTNSLPSKHKSNEKPDPTEPTPSKPAPKPSSEPNSKAKDEIGHGDLHDPWG
jgi:serine/threonine-protein kinase